MAAIALLLIHAVGGFAFFLFSLPERSEWAAMTTGIICSTVAALLVINYRRTYGPGSAPQP
ncbi:hypothetical protein [uncultured Arthrobacter sp.]|uniref:hypothetical protein n=1 Tax=uncultured Arthrobacter sp. TaxID=114050 RepID=UPI002634AD7A|nr:hypothetical protein [uncultured Arthrobacter sp.]